MPQDPATRGLMRVDPIAKKTGLSGYYHRHAAAMNPWEAKLNKADPVQKAYASQPAPRSGNLLRIETNQVQ